MPNTLQVLSRIASKTSRINTRFLRYLVKNPNMIPSAFRLFTGAERYARKYFDKKMIICPPPISITIRITNRCNLNCIQCGQWGKSGIYKNAKKEILKKELNTSQIKSFIENLARFRPLVSFFGGEPLLRDDITSLVKFSNVNNLLTSLTTNCILLEEKAESLIKSGLTFIKVSLDAPENINDRIRGQGSYQKIHKGIQHLIRVRKKLRSLTPIIQMNTTITKENQNYILDTARIADELNVDIFALLFGIFTTPSLLSESKEICQKKLNFEPAYWEGFLIDYSDMDTKIIKEQVNKIKNSKEWKFSYRQYPAKTRSFDVARHYGHPEQVHGKGLCITPWFNMQLMPDGTIALCEDTPDYIAGNIFDDDPLAIWNGSKYKKFRKYILEEGILPVCTRCSALYENAHYLNDSEF